MSDLKKILVVGSGIAGPSVCYWLKRFGFSPTLIEKQPDIRTGGQALDVRGVATHIAREMGIYDQISNQRTRIECGRHVDVEGNILQEEHGETFGFRQDDDVEIVRGDLVRILMGTIPDVPCHFGQTVNRIDQNEEAVAVTFEDGRMEHYDLVIGADGIYSSIRRMVFDEDEYQLVKLGSYLSTFTVPNYLNLQRTELMCEKDQKLIRISSDQDPDEAIVGFMFRSRHELRDPRDENEQKRFLCDTFRDFGWEAERILDLMPNSDDFYFDSISQVKMKSWTKGRVALVGDAGYCASPLSGQGNNLAFVGAYLLAGELKVAKGNYNQAFKRYNELMRPFVEENQGFGLWVSKSYLVPDEVSEKVAEERTDKILKMIKRVSNAIVLPDYEH